MNNYDIYSIHCSNKGLVNHSGLYFRVVSDQTLKQYHNYCFYASLLHPVYIKILFSFLFLAFIPFSLLCCTDLVLKAKLKGLCSPHQPSSTYLDYLHNPI